MSRDTSSTARTSPLAGAPNMDWPRGKIFIRLRISTRGIRGHTIHAENVAWAPPPAVRNGKGARRPCCDLKWEGQLPFPITMEARVPLADKLEPVAPPRLFDS